MRGLALGSSSLPAQAARATFYFGTEGGRLESRYRAQQLFRALKKELPDLHAEMRASTDNSDDCFAYVLATLDANNATKVFDVVRDHCTTWETGVVVSNQQRVVVARGSDLFELDPKQLVARALLPSDEAGNVNELAPLTTEFIDPVDGWQMSDLMDLMDLRPQISELGAGDPEYYGGPIELYGRCRDGSERTLKISAAEGGGLHMRLRNPATQPDNDSEIPNRPVLTVERVVAAVSAFLRSGRLAQLISFGALLTQDII